MSDRIDLSADTWIDKEHLVTTSHEVAAAWPIEKSQIRDVDDTGHVAIGWRGLKPEDGELCQWDFGGYHYEWRIHRATAREVYQYVGGEAWAGATGSSVANGIHCFVGSGVGYCGAILRRRAALVCDTAEQFRALHEWIGGKGL